MTLAPHRHSSSTFIAHLLVQQYPPKVQPQSSSARDHALFGHLDKVDAEAGCILIALANHDKRKDMNDLIPYSIRVIDYNQTSTHNSTLDGSISSSSISSNSSDSSSSPSPHTDNEDPINSTEKPGHDGGTMSIKNLLGMNGKPTSSSVTDTPTLSGMTDPPSNTDQSSLSSSTTKMPTTTSQHNDINDQPKTQQTLKRKPRTDPILLLAAAAKAIDQDEQLQQQQQQRARQKRKYSDDESSMDSRSHSARPRHHVEGQATAIDQRQSEKSKFSFQYFSMKQNPKIKRNAMHAYITYMIYTDLASSDKMYHHDKDIHHQSTTAAPVVPSLPPPPPPPSTTITTTTQMSSTYPLPASPYPTLTSTSTNQRTAIPTTASTSSSSSSSTPLPMTFDQQQYAQRSSYSSRINIPTTATTGTNASSSETHPWPYGLVSLSSSTSSSSPPSPPLPLLPSGGSTNRATANSSIMARPLTAFLRDDMYT